MSHLFFTKTTSVIVCCVLVIALIATGVLSQSNPFPAENKTEDPVTEKSESIIDNATRNLHRWGAVTLFHGLPSDRVNAIVEDASGALWFGTDNGLVRYDGRSTELFTGEGASVLPSARIRALKLDAGGGLWVGTESGAVRIINSSVTPIAGTQGRSVRAMAESAQRDIALVTDRGEILHYVSQSVAGGEPITRSTPYADPEFGGVISQKLDGSSQSLLSINSDKSGEQLSLELTAIAATAAGDWWIGSNRRGALVQNHAQLREAALRPPRPYFVSAVQEFAGQVWVGAQAGEAGSGLWIVRNSVMERFPLATGNVTHIHSSEDGLWIGTDREGAFLLRGEQVIEHLTFENTAGGLRSNHINTIFRDHEGIIWFGTDRGVCRYDRESFRSAIIAAGAESNFIRSLLITKNGETLAGSNRGLFSLGRGLELGAWAQVAEISDRSIYTLKEDTSGHVFAGTGDGLFMRTSGTGRFSMVPMEGETIESEPSSEPNAQTKSVDTAADASAKKDDASVPKDEGADAVRNSPARNRAAVRALTIFRGRLHALHFGQGIAQVESGTQKFILTDDNARRAVCLMTEPGAAGKSDMALWYATNAGEVFRYDGTRTAPITQDGVRRLFDARQAVQAMAFANGRVWFGTAKGLYQWDGRQLQQVIGDVDVQSLLVVREEALPEILPQSLLGRFVPGRDALKSINAAKAEGVAGIPDQPLSREVMWCGTINAGLIKMLSRDRVSIHFDTEQGLASQKVFAVAARTFTDSSTKKIADKIWIGTNRGIVLHQPGRVAPRLESRRLVADRVYSPAELEAEINLPHTQSSFLLEVAALGSRTYPGQFQYEFTLRDKVGAAVKTVISADSQFAVEKIDPGPYSLWVRAISRDLIYSEPLKIRLRFQPSPFPWTTVMLASLLTVAIAAAGYAFIQNRRTARANLQLAETNQELQETRLRLARETEAERSRIARDLHDQTLGDLRHLLVMTDQLEKATSEKGAPEKHADVTHQSLPTPSTVRREIERISSEIRHICEDLSPSVLENIGFLPSLEWALSDAVAHLPAGEKFAYEFICETELEDRLRLSEVERIQLYRIVQEAINNICRHAHARHVRLEVRADVSDSQADDGAGRDDLSDLVICVQDDGSGFDGTRLSATGHGIPNIRSRANLISAQVAWQNTANGYGSGCQFEIRKTEAVAAGKGSA
jgi:ligand-binding sensor domain-containing protein/signal transduction histidine kinase